MSPWPRVPVCPVPTFPCPHVRVSSCPHALVFPRPRVPVSSCPRFRVPVPDLSGFRRLSGELCAEELPSLPGAGPSLRGRWAVMGADPTRVPPPPSPPARRLLDALNADGAGAARAERAGPPPGRALPGDQQRLRAGGGRRGAAGGGIPAAHPAPRSATHLFHRAQTDGAAAAAPAAPGHQQGLRRHASGAGPGAGLGSGTNGGTGLRPKGRGRVGGRGGALRTGRVGPR